jgi:hypothetical protein
MISRCLTYVVSILLVCTACQSHVPGPAHPVTPATPFMTMWDEYQHCLYRDDLDEVMSDVDRLSAWAGQIPPPPPPMLRPMHPWVYPLPIRTAADPKAMLADCTLRAAHLAKERQLFAVAEVLYKRVSEELPHDRYAYYVSEAKAGLDDLRQAQINRP